MDASLYFTGGHPFYYMNLYNNYDILELKFLVVLINEERVLKNGVVVYL